MRSQIEIKGRDPMVDDLSVRIDFHDHKRFSLHLWRPDPKSYGKIGMALNHPQALRAYALGLLEMADRFEAAVRPEWEARGGGWIEEPAPAPQTDRGEGRGRMDKAITLAELQEIAKTRWIRPRNRDGVNPHMEVPQKGGTLRDEYGRMHFEWRGFLLRVDSAEWSDAENGTYHRITLYGH